MDQKVDLLETTLNDFTADSLEAEAAKMPPSYKTQADILRKHAAEIRRIPSKTIWIRQRTISVKGK